MRNSVSMKSHLCVVFFVVCVFRCLVSANGESPFAALEFPIGARNTAMGEAGASLAVGLASMYYNPACLPSAMTAMDNYVAYSRFSEILLPSVFSDLLHSVDAFALSTRDLIPHVKLAVGHFANTISYGEEFSERVRSFTTSASVSNTASLGLNWKEYQNDNLISFSGSQALFQGNAVDIGILLQRRIAPQRRFSYLRPALGLSILNLGDSIPDPFMSSRKNPLPKQWKSGVSLAMGLESFLEIVLVSEMTGNLLVKESPIIHLGSEFSLASVLSFQFGIMIDKPGSRYELPIGTALAFDLKDVILLFHRIRLWDFSPGSERIKEESDRLDSIKFLPNPRFSQGLNWIKEIDGDGSIAREGQTRVELGIGL